MPASVTSAMRSPLRGAAAARRRAPPRCARGRKAAAPRCRAGRATRGCDACPRRARRPRLAELGENAQRYVFEVADRRRTDGQRHYAGTASKATRPAPIRPASAPSSAVLICSPAAVAEHLAHDRRASRRQQLVERRDPEAAADHDEFGPKMLIEEPIATPRWWPTDSSAGCRAADRSRAVACSPRTLLASRSRRCRSSTTRHGLARRTRPCTARRPRRSPCGRARSTRERAARRRRSRRRPRFRA